MALAIEWAQHDRRIGELGLYIKRRIERKIPQLGFERYLRRKPFLRRTEFSAIGVFLIFDLLSIALAWVGPSDGPYERYVPTVIAIDLVVTGLTTLILLGRSFLVLIKLLTKRRGKQKACPVNASACPTRQPNECNNKQSVVQQEHNACINKQSIESFPSGD